PLLPPAGDDQLVDRAATGPDQARGQGLPHPPAAQERDHAFVHATSSCHPRSPEPSARLILGPGAGSTRRTTCSQDARPFVASGTGTTVSRTGRRPARVGLRPPAGPAS